MPLNQTSLWRNTLRPGSRFGTPYEQYQIPQPEEPNILQRMWRGITPWKEERGETLGTAWQQFMGTPLPGFQKRTWGKALGELGEFAMGASIALPTAGMGFKALGAMARGATGARAVGARVGQAVLAPVAGAEKVIGLAARGVGKLAAPVARPVGRALERAIAPIVGPKFVRGKIILPSGAEIEATMQQDWRRRLAQVLGRNAVLRKMVEVIGGPRALVNVESKELRDVTLKELVKHSVIMDSRHNVQGLLMPRLQEFGDPMRLLKVGNKGLVGAVREKGYLYDVLEHPEKFTWLDPAARKYTTELRKILREVYALAKKEGVDIPPGIIVHRMVKGKFTPAGYEASEFGSRFEARRKYLTMQDGVEIGKIDYGLNSNDSVAATINHFIKKIADKRLANEILKIAPRGARGGFRYKPTWGEKRTFISPAFRDAKGRPIVFPEEVVNIAEKYLGDQGNTWLRSMAGISGTGRLLVAALDFSAPFIQGLPILGRRPDVWARATLNHYKFFMQPKKLYQYLNSAETKAIRAERFHFGASTQPFEFFRALEPVQRALGKIPKVGAALRRGVQETYGRAESAFTGYGELARNEMWKALRRPNMAQAELRELATVLDRMTGVMSTEALGIGLSQREFENAFLFFAPRYTRAGLKLFADMFTGGLTGRMARRSMAQLAAGGTAMYIGVVTAMGQEPKLDPTKGEFMTIEVGGDKIGIGGMITALTRFGANIVATATESPMDLIQPFKDKRLNRWDNPFIRFMFSKSAPLTGLTIGAAVENADYFGNPLEEPSDWIKFLADKITPIAFQRVMPWSGEKPSPLGAVAEVSGMRTFPAKIPKSPAVVRRMAYQDIEDRNWARYPGSLRKTAEEIAKLERGDDAEQAKARRLLQQYPQIMMARRMIALEKKRWKAMNQPTAGRGLGAPSRLRGGLLG